MSPGMIKCVYRPWRMRANRMWAVTIALHVRPAGGSALLLRPWLAADMPALVAEMEREYPKRGLWPNPDTGAPARSAWTGPTDDQDAVEWLVSQDRGWSDGHWLTFAVLEQEQSARDYCLVGHVGLKALASGIRVSESESAEVSYWTAVSARGRGIASAALQAVTHWALESFSAKGLRQIKLVHDVDNYASCRVADKSGYALQEISPARPPKWATAAHIHTRAAG
jgi:RimJ/RimL family protein N-acetyltransferase